MEKDIRNVKNGKKSGNNMCKGCLGRIYLSRIFPSNTLPDFQYALKYGLSEM